MEIVVSVQNVHKKFKSPVKQSFWKNIFTPKSEFIEVVKGVSFDIKKGESVAFLGPNGAGKTTTTKMMTGLIYPSSGDINVIGFTPQDRKKDFLMRIGLVMGNKTGLNWDLTARQTFEIYKKIYRIPEEKYQNHLKNLTETLNVADHLDKPVRKLSLGERMKLELIGAILHDPEVLFLDEPTIGLDITSKQNIRKFLRNIQKESGITLVLTSHDMDDIEHVCDRVIVINKGSIVYDDDMQTLKNKYSKERYVKFIFDTLPNEEALNSLGNIYETKNNTATFSTEPNNLPTLISSVTAKYSILDIEIESVPLEEMIKEIFESETE